MTEEDILEFTKRTGLSVFEASAKTGSGVESSFIALTDALIDKAQKQNQNNSSDGRQSTSGYSNKEEVSQQDSQAFDEGRIKMKRIDGRGLGLSKTDKAVLYCC